MLASEHSSISHIVFHLLLCGFLNLRHELQSAEVVPKKQVFETTRLGIGP
jgi:hypothetical protein